MLRGSLHENRSSMRTSTRSGSCRATRVSVSVNRSDLVFVYRYLVRNSVDESFVEPENQLSTVPTHRQGRQTGQSTVPLKRNSSTDYADYPDKMRNQKPKTITRRYYES